jgi:hypothetical protein
MTDEQQLQQKVDAVFQNVNVADDILRMLYKQWPYEHYELTFTADKAGTYFYITEEEKRLQNTRVLFRGNLAETLLWLRSHT